jgi:predicted alpha/beta-hydrolase family hydrolase
LVKQSARFEEFQIPLTETIHGLDSVSAVLGIPEWWPTGPRIAVTLAHGARLDKQGPLLELLQRQLTESSFLTLRFNFPFADARTNSESDDIETLDRTFRAALSALSHLPTTPPSQVFVGGIGLGAQVSARIATNHPRIEGAFFMGYPLHPKDAPQLVDAEPLSRITAPLLFIQGSEDPRCHLDALIRTVRRVGTPSEVRSISEVGEDFSAIEGSSRQADAVQAEIFGHIQRWVQKHQAQL